MSEYGAAYLSGYTSLGYAARYHPQRRTRITTEMVPSLPPCAGSIRVWSAPTQGGTTVVCGIGSPHSTRTGQIAPKVRTPWWSPSPLSTGPACAALSRACDDYWP